MRVLLDTNVILDVFLDRPQFIKDSSSVWQAVDEGRIEGHVSASSITDIYYIVRRHAGREKARASIEVCLEAFEVCVVNRETLEEAAALMGNDFEDNLQIACARQSGLDAIVTRDDKDYARSIVSALTPAQLIEKLK
jgi:predicted nucleic acid-binding protein